MKPEKEKAIQEAFGEIPEVIQDTLSYMDWERTIESIGHRYGLSPYGMEALLSETALVLCGLADAEKFYDEVHYQTRTDAETAERIVIDVTNEIFIELQKRIGRLRMDESDDEPVSETLNALNQQEQQKIHVPQKSHAIPKRPPVNPRTTNYAQQDPYRENV